jgi:hypothetical protein
VEEQEYKATYHKIASVRCIFEKALTNNHARCSCARHFWLADREGYACKSGDASEKCRELLSILREKSRFVLKIQQAGGLLPHNMELRVQAGGLQGLRSHFEAGSTGQIVDVHALVRRAEEKFSGFGRLPFDEIVQSVARFRGRKRKIRD